MVFFTGCLISLSNKWPRFRGHYPYISLYLVVMMTVMMPAMDDHDLFGAGTIPAALAFRGLYV